MSNRWEDTEDLLVASAEIDLRADVTVQPALVAFTGANLRFVAWVRPFAKGQYAQPLIELFALAAPLDCDRMMLSLSGRAWSLADPIAPVTEDVDLRQRVLLLYTVDGADGPARRWCILHTFEPGDDGPVWGERRVLEGGEGWIPEALEAVVASRHRFRAPVAEVARQAARVARLGHDLHVSPDVAALLFRPTRANKR